MRKWKAEVSLAAIVPMALSLSFVESHKLPNTLKNGYRVGSAVRTIYRVGSGSHDWAFRRSAQRTLRLVL